MPNPVDDNTRRVGAVENHIWIGSYHRPADAILAGKASRIRVIRKQVDHGLESPLDVVSPLQRTSIDEGEDSVNCRSARRV